MGFLNNTTVTVDAILTKKGRELLAQGTEAFNITKFALADDEVDYNLFDVTHPNGSDFFGNVIENKLITLPKNTSKMPVINSSVPSIIFEAAGGIQQPDRIVTATTANVSDSSYTFILHDQSVCTMNINEGAGSGVGATTPFFLGDDDVPNSKTLVAKSVNIGNGQPVNTEKATQLTIIGNDTGATTSITITNNVTLAAVFGE